MPASDSVKVAVRVRPFNQREKSAGSKCILSMKGNATYITNPQNGNTKTFSFDHSYWSHDGFMEDDTGVLVTKSKTYADQRTVFSDLGQGVLDNAWQGYNAALFAYGQTGSGKSFSMIGYGPNKGIVPITCGELFKAIEENKDKKKQLQVTFSMLEIYNEQVKDLLASVKQHQAGGLRIRQNPNAGFYVEGLKQVPVQGYKQIEKLMEQGTVNRTTASTNMNATSSRSHMVITIKFNQVFENDMGESTTKSSEISLVDLAGSERADSTGATGDRLKEGSAINQSLSTLGNVISALADLAMGKKKVIVPYRDSALTKLLQSALGGNSRTIMIAALSPADINYDETLSTLRYADRAKKIQNKAVINESPTDRLIRELKEENARLMVLLGGGQKGGNKMGTESTGELQKMLEENERKMQEMALSWEQRLEQAKRDWEKTGGTEEARQWEVHPYISNVNEDPMLSGVIKYCFTQQSSLIGRIGSPDVAIELRGFGIQLSHAVVLQEKQQMYIEPCGPQCLVVINGVMVRQKHKLNHLDRLKLGSNSLFQFVGFASERHASDTRYDYNFIQMELAESEGVRSDLDTPCSPDADLDLQSTVVFQDYVNLLPQIAEANGISDELEKNVKFSLEMKSYTSHDPQGRDKKKDVIVCVTNVNTYQVWIWSGEKFINRKNLMDEMYLSYLDGVNVKVDKMRDPFWDPMEDLFLGSCHVWLQSLAYHLDIDEHLSLHNYRGKEEAVVHVKIVPCGPDGKPNTDDNAVMEPKELLGKPFHFLVSLNRVMEVRWVEEHPSRGIYLSAKVPGTTEVVKTDTVWRRHMAEMNYSRKFCIKNITTDFLTQLKTHALVLELWGTQADDERRARKLPPSSLNGHINGYANNHRKDQVMNGPSTIKGNQHKVSDAHMSELENELEEMREDYDDLKRENFRLKQTLERQKQAAQLRHRISSSSMDEEDELDRPFVRTGKRVLSRQSSNRSLSPVSIHHSPTRSTSVLDVDLAKGLRDFFKDVKEVQKELCRVRDANAGVENSNDKSTLKTAIIQQREVLKSAEVHLATTVVSLKESVTNAIRKSHLNHTNK